MGSLGFGVMQSNRGLGASRGPVAPASGCRLASSWAGSQGAAHRDLAAARLACGEGVARLGRDAGAQSIGGVAAHEPELVAQCPPTPVVGAQRAERGPLAGRLLDLELDQLPAGSGRLATRPRNTT